MQRHAGLRRSKLGKACTVPEVEQRILQRANFDQQVAFFEKPPHDPDLYPYNIKWESDLKFNHDLLLCMAE
ncbi:hypothetical protein NDU88_000440 [Pleurodeles waltl]|uniref:Uncharacterized protein n=1 Tax=Pleurodeles waltl TaxID=8319 RepID=A0AAV7LIL1_PLEWA|nr:hypothetical protein NDU88_000440 [Pleurodeles waltl]